MDIYTRLAQTLDALPNGFPFTRDGNAEIYLMNPDGSQLVRATNNLASDSEPAWSPDGKQIAFLSKRNGNIDIYLLDAHFPLEPGK